MTHYENLYVVKTANAFDDTLLMFGVAEMAADLLDRQPETGDVRIHDKGAYYHLELTEPLKANTVEREAETLFPLWFIKTEKSPVPEGMTFTPHDLDDLREKENAYYEARKSNQEQEEKPDTLLPHLKAIRDFNKFNILGSYNALVEQWHAMGRDPDTVFLLLDYFSQQHPDMDMLTDGWKALSKKKKWKYDTKTKYESTALQLYNPASGKGQNRSKADGVTMSNISNLWLLEYLKAVGFFAGALPKQLRGSGDQKTLVLAPKRLDYIREHRNLMSDFRETMRYSETSIRFDVLASLRYARTLLKHILSDQQTTRTRRRRRNLRHHFVDGFYTAFYKDMGNAVATMNLSFVALPGWITVESEDDVSVYDAMLERLEDLVTQFDEEKSEEHTLLRHLRDFISGNQLRSFLAFTTGYSSYYMRERDRPNGFARALSIDLIERMVTHMGKNLAELADRQKHPGFHNVAAAIATSTVWAQTNKNTSPYKIRYGLHRDLARQAQTPEKFMKALGEFIHTYNAETARAKELNKSGARDYIQPEDIDDVLTVMNKFGNDSQLVAQVLLAYGSTFSKFIRRNSTESNEQETTS